MTPAAGFAVIVSLLASGMCQAPPPGRSLANLDSGLQFQFVEIELLDGTVLSGEVVGVFNERHFMWSPADRDTIVVVHIGFPLLGPDSFANSHENGDALNSVFSLSTDEIESVRIIRRPEGAVSYLEYLRQHNVAIQHQPVEGEMWVATAFNSYHLWEDGRGNYAWDLNTLNDNMMTYTRLGQALNDYDVFGKNVYIPMPGTVVSAVGHHPDNAPELVEAIDFEFLDSGTEADLEEKPHNQVEITPGGPFLLRLLHQEQDSVPVSSLPVGSAVSAGTFAGRVGNSGTTYVPHLHLVFGFTDAAGRFWAMPIEWSQYRQRDLLAYPTGYVYGDYKQRNNDFPKKGQCVTVD